MDNQATQANPTANSKKPKDRSPAYPAISLQKAIDFSQVLWEKEKRQPALIGLAMSHLGYTEKSSNGLLAIAAMKKYGLLEDEGSGRARKVKLTDLAIRLLNPSNADRKADLLKAALLPPILKELWESFRDGGSDDNIYNLLVFERGFNEAAAKKLITIFRDTIAYSGLDKTDKSGDKGPSDDNLDEAIQPSIGSYIQWISDDVEQFPEPKQIVGFSDDGEWAFVEGSPTGIAMSELSLADPPKKEQETDTLPPPNPFAKPKNGIEEVASEKYAKERFTTEEGPVVLQWPLELSKDSVEDIEFWLESVMRRTRRNAGLPSKKKDQ